MIFLTICANLQQTVENLFTNAAFWLKYKKKIIDSIVNLKVTFFFFSMPLNPY